MRRVYIVGPRIGTENRLAWNPLFASTTVIPFLAASRVILFTIHLNHEVIGIIMGVITLAAGYVAS
jgi:hypothetical protein